MQFAGSPFPPGFFEYTGRYVVTDSLHTLTWDANPTAPWVARALLRGDSLVVRFNDDMSMSDFIDGTYVRTRDAN
jgi:hypothetical protein